MYVRVCVWGGIYRQACICVCMSASAQGCVYLFVFLYERENIMKGIQVSVFVCGLLSLYIHACPCVSTYICVCVVTVRVRHIVCVYVLPCLCCWHPYTWMLLPAWGEALSSFQCDESASKKVSSQTHCCTKCGRLCSDPKVAGLNPEGVVQNLMSRPAGCQLDLCHGS